MTVQTKAVIKSYFETGDKPNQSQFGDLIDSYQNSSQSLTAIQSAMAIGSGLINVVNASAATLTTAGTTGLAILGDNTAASARSNIGISTSELITIIDGGGVTITPGVKGNFVSKFNFSISEWTLTADQSSSIVIDIWKSPYSTYTATVPSSANSITGSGKPTITASAKNTATTGNWSNTIVSAGDVLRFNVDSVSSAANVTLTLTTSRT